MTHPNPRCSATCSGKRRPDRAGQRCTNPPMAGQKTCRMHGGSSRQAKTKAAERAAENEIRRILDGFEPTPVENPLAALKILAGRVLAWSQVAEDQLSKVPSIETWSDAQGEQVRAAVVVFERALDGARRVLVDMARLKLDERIAAINERTAAAFLEVFRAVIAHPDLALTGDQRQAMPGVVRDVLRQHAHPTPGLN
ncbi:HGGxSTG domain-containing protein [Frankia sp. AgB1.8]|uniref:HGGxSTG domain-containing protein n=1 Tax=Frankia sp. AgB1.8 TaxID=2792839 RepID=UPI0027DD7BBC|nr:HGGxSTG domain-containing protein [Frankia sp. AgB1.8]